MSTAIQQVQQVGLSVSEWPPEIWEVVRQQTCPKGITEAEFVVFAAQCKARGLNPLAGEAFCVPRRTNVGDKNNPKWVTNHVFQASAEGMQARAARFPDFLKVDSAAVYEKDPSPLVDTAEGKVRHTFDPTKPRGRLMGAWGRVVKKDGSAVVAWLDVADRSGNSTFWNTSQARMLEKCARVAALRQAYPVAFAGVYAAEEMATEAPAPSMAEKVLAAAEGHAAPVAEAPALPPAGPVVEFGEWKGRPVSGLALDEAQAAVAFAEAELAKANPKARWIPKMRDNLALVSEHANRLSLLVSAAQSKPNAPFDAEWRDSEPPADVVLPTGREPGEDG